MTRLTCGIECKEEAPPARIHANLRQNPGNAFEM